MADENIRFAVVGLGAIGGYYAGLLARAGFRVYAVARGQQLATVRAHGLTIRTPSDSWTSRIEATDDAKEIAKSLGPADCVLLAVKSYSLDSAGPIVRQLSDAGCCVLPLLNGVDLQSRMAGFAPSPQQILGGLAVVSTVVTAPGVIERRSTFDRIRLGEMPRGTSARCERIAAALRLGGCDAAAVPDVDVETWRKFAFITSIGAACVIRRACIGDVLSDDGGRELLRSALREVLAVAAHREIALGADAEAQIWASIIGLSPSLKPSLLVDVELGRQTEINSLSGKVVSMGQAAGIATPTHQAAVSSILGAPSTA